MVTVYSNRDGYTRNNLLVDDAGCVAAYDPTRSKPGLNGVDIGYALLSKTSFGKGQVTVVTCVTCFGNKQLKTASNLRLLNYLFDTITPITKQPTST